MSDSKIEASVSANGVATESKPADGTDQGVKDASVNQEVTKIESGAKKSESGTNELEELMKQYSMDLLQTFERKAEKEAAEAAAAKENEVDKGLIAAIKGLFTKKETEKKSESKGDEISASKEQDKKEVKGTDGKEGVSVDIEGILNENNKLKEEIQAKLKTLDDIIEATKVTEAEKKANALIKDLFDSINKTRQTALPKELYPLIKPYINGESVDLKAFYERWPQFKDKVNGKAVSGGLISSDSFGDLINTMMMKQHQKKRSW